MAAFASICRPESPSIRTSEKAPLAEIQRALGTKCTAYVRETLRTGLRADLRYSKFNSSFGSGDYKALSLSRSLGDRLEWQLIGGLQNFNSTITTTTQTRFVNTYRPGLRVSSCFSRRATRGSAAER